MQSEVTFTTDTADIENRAPLPYPGLDISKGNVG